MKQETKLAIHDMRIFVAILYKKVGELNRVIDMMASSMTEDNDYNRELVKGWELNYKEILATKYLCDLEKREEKLWIHLLNTFGEEPS